MDGLEDSYGSFYIESSASVVLIQAMADYVNIPIDGTLIFYRSFNYIRLIMDKLNAKYVKYPEFDKSEMSRANSSK